ncbi:MAG TPA: hypothetical protein EYP88_08510, partial [Anaerolineales bacterium]|nr:hypothetical protein [Anaerolineales bacterium]
MSTQQPSNSTPSQPWSPTVKIVVGLIFVTIISALLIRFRSLLGPLVLAFMLTYLLQPLVAWISRSTRITWRITVNLVFLILVVVLVFGASEDKDIAGMLAELLPRARE